MTQSPHRESPPCLSPSSLSLFLQRFRSPILHNSRMRDSEPSEPFLGIVTFTET